MVGLYLTYLRQEARSTVCSSGFPLMGIKVYFTAQSYGDTYNLNISFMHPTEIASIEMFSTSYKHDTHTFEIFRFHIGVL